MMRRTRGSVNRASSESRWVARAKMSRSFAMSIFSEVMGSVTGTFILSTISRASAFTSQG